ncbi:DUF4329 domain-containing protein [Pseudomonas syringae]|nr:DUF4329 domain-containing protein [Pseudomonas syringae]MCF5068399.1 DUF4329 domain-containing protein [Pseudomonas syringae]
MNDLSGRVARAAYTGKKVRLPKLSPAFSSEQDAAYWAHRQIPMNADKEYGSLILQVSTGWFAATTPLAGEAQQFDMRLLLEVDAAGNYVPPKDYTCVASFHSHINQFDKYQRLRPDWDAMTVRLFMSFYSTADFVADVADRRFFPAAYLSGPHGSLLRYAPSGSADETAYWQWIRADMPADSPVAVAGVANIIRRMATVGELKVVVSNADWGGSVGKVPPNWRPGKVFSKGVLTEQPLMTQMVKTASLAVRIALRRKNALTSGLILKQINVENYIATLPNHFEPSVWNPERYFPLDAKGRLKLPQGYALEGFYYASRPDRAGVTHKQPWISQSFFTPGELALAIACYAKSKALHLANRPLSLYMQSMDAALLKYSFADSALEAAMSKTLPDGTVTDGGMQKKLDSGKMQPRGFVTAVAAAGRLEVLLNSSLWDREGLVGADWMPYADFTWPVLSPAFLTADDAARYAHEKVGRRRDRQYAGYVFQIPGRRFVATVPLPTQSLSIGQGLFYPKDVFGQSVFPQDHVLHGHYVSHAALSTLDLSMVERLKWSREEAALSLQMFTVEEARRLLLVDGPVYLSGSAQSLISFKTDNSPHAETFRHRLGTHEHPGELALGLDSGSQRPGDFIRALAGAGHVNVVMAGHLWGARGRLEPSWSMLSSPPAWSRPQRVAFGAVFASADEAAQDQYSRNQKPHDREQAWFGFILKHRTREEYVASELSPVSEQSNDLFQPQRLFSWTREAPWFSYPEEFDRHAFFYLRQQVKHPSSKPQDWIANHFIRPDDLFVAVYYSKRNTVIPHQPVPLYLSSQDGALLKYVPRGDTRLFDNDTPDMGLEDIKQNLKAQRLSFTGYVRVVAQSGELSVLRNSACWDRLGKVDTQWSPMSNFQRRWLSPAFENPDDAARYARSQMPANADGSCGGLILERWDGLYLATDPIAIAREDFDKQWIYPDETKALGLFPDDCRAVARYRSRQVQGFEVLLTESERQIYLNMLSVDVLLSAFERSVLNTLRVDYLFAPDGAVIRYEAGYLDQYRAAAARAFTDGRKVPEDLNPELIKAHIRDGTIKPSEWVQVMISAGYMQVITGSALWGQPRRVTEWQPNPVIELAPGDFAKVLADPPMSPLFPQHDSIARFVHEVKEDIAELSFGFILWSAKHNCFVATLPVTEPGPHIKVDRVFADGVLPRSHTLHSVYLRAPKKVWNVRDDDHRQFFSPLEIHRICALANYPDGYKVIYLSCADGALLRFEMDPFDPAPSLDRFGQVQFLPNPFASLAQAMSDEYEISVNRFKLRDYIQRMARAGKLEVVLTSTYWSRHGVVDDTWQPRMADVDFETRWRSNQTLFHSPVYQHADDAARYAHRRMSLRYEPGAGFEGAILRKDNTHAYLALEPLPYDGYSVHPLRLIFRTVHDLQLKKLAPLYPHGYRVVGAHQLHWSDPGATPEQEDFAATLMVYAHTLELKAKGFDIQHYYYSSPNDVLLKYSPSYTEAEKELLLETRVFGSSNGTVASIDFVSRLAKAGAVDVLIPGSYWQQPGRLDTGWRSDRLYSPKPPLVLMHDEF